MPPRHATCPSCQNYEFTYWDKFRASRKQGTRCPNCEAEIQLKRRVGFFSLHLILNAISAVTFIPTMVVGLWGGIWWMIAFILAVWLPIGLSCVLYEAHVAQLEPVP